MQRQLLLPLSPVLAANDTIPVLWWSNCDIYDSYDQFREWNKSCTCGGRGRDDGRENAANFPLPTVTLFTPFPPFRFDLVSQQW